MWTFIQRSGAFLKPDGSQLTVGYSGNWDGVPPPGGPNDHRNRPEDQRIKYKGPIPVGRYAIGPAYDDPGGKGPIVMALTPDPANQMFGRNAFLIHGDRAPPRSGTASDGCVILDHDSRQTISESDDRALRVVADREATLGAQAALLAAAVPAAKKTARKAPKKAAKKAAKKTVRKPVKKSPPKKPARQKKAPAKGTKKGTVVARKPTRSAPKKAKKPVLAAKKATRRSRRP